MKPVEHSDKECAGRLLEVVLAVTSSGVIELVEARTVVVPINKIRESLSSGCVSLEIDNVYTVSRTYIKA